MRTVVIARYGSIPGMGSFGGLITDNFSCLTVEREWKNNEPEVSCIPLGNYVCSLTDSPKFGKVYEVTAVPGRSHILIHPSNVQSDLLGCIGLGDSWGYVKNQWAVLNSAATLKRFMDNLDGEDFHLVIEREI